MSGAVVYFEGDAEKAAKRAKAHGGKVRLSNAKWFNPGEIEYRGTKKGPAGGMVPVLFSDVFCLPGVRCFDAIAETYRDYGIEVKWLGNGGGGAPAKSEAAPVAVPVKTPEDFGWKLKRSPAEYLAKFPQGSSAELAEKIVAEVGG